MSIHDSFSRREFTKVAALTLAAGSGVVPRAPGLGAGPRSDAAAAGPEPRFPAAWPGYDRAVVIDALATPTHFNVPDSFARPLTPEMVENARRSGITGCNVTVNGFGADAEEAFVETVHNIGYCERELAAHPDLFARVRTVADLRRAKSDGKVGLIYGFQDTTMLGGEVSRVDIFHDLGVRIVQLTYNRRNLIGDGCLEEANAGLSAFGRAAVRRMNERGILVDLSHCGQQTTIDTIRHSTKPVAFTHTACQALVPVPRNKTDAQLKLLAERGGVAGIYFMPFLRATGQPNADDVVHHIEHALNICGEEHVGVGSDLSITPLDLTPAFRKKHADFVAERARQGISAPGEAPDVFNYVPDFNGPRRLDLLADALARKGHPAARIERILGGNWLRLFGDVWA